MYNDEEYEIENGPCNYKEHGTKTDSWFNRNWRPAAAAIYLFICLFDFVITPVYYAAHQPVLTDIINSIEKSPTEVQMLILNSRFARWEPLTLMGGGMFHIAFGAILGAAAWQRGQEKMTQMRSNVEAIRYTNNPPNPGPGRSRLD